MCCLVLCCVGNECIIGMSCIVLQCMHVVVVGCSVMLSYRRVVPCIAVSCSA